MFQYETQCDKTAFMSSAIQAVHGEALEPAVEIRIVTERSLWLIRPDRYLRMPRGEHFRERTEAIENRLDDHTWHEHRGAYWQANIYGLRVRIKPVLGPADGAGILTGPVIEIRGH